jgi:hypothetical protein
MKPVLYIQVSLITYEGCIPVNYHIHKKCAKHDMYNNIHFDVKLVPEFFNAKFTICIKFTDKPGNLLQVTGFKIWQ